MRFCNQVKIKGQECLEASITHNFTLCCLQKSVLGTILNAIHWCLWFAFAVPGSRIACKISSCSSIDGKRAKKLKWWNFDFIFGCLWLAQIQLNNSTFKMLFISRRPLCIDTLYRVYFIVCVQAVRRPSEIPISEAFLSFKRQVPSIINNFGSHFMSLELDVLWNETSKQITTENVQSSWKRGIIPNPLFNNNPKWIIPIRDVNWFCGLQWHR